MLYAHHPPDGSWDIGAEVGESVARIVRIVQIVFVDFADSEQRIYTLLAARIFLAQKFVFANGQPRIFSSSNCRPISTMTSASATTADDALPGGWRFQVHTAIGIHNTLVFDARTFLHRTPIQRFAHTLGGVELCVGPVSGFVGTRVGREKRQRHEERNGSHAQGARASSEILQCSRP